MNNVTLHIEDIGDGWKAAWGSNVPEGYPEDDNRVCLIGKVDSPTHNFISQTWGSFYLMMSRDSRPALKDEQWWVATFVADHGHQSKRTMALIAKESIIAHHKPKPTVDFTKPEWYAKAYNKISASGGFYCAFINKDVATFYRGDHLESTVQYTPKDFT